MYQIKVRHNVKDAPVLEMATESRHLARAMSLLGQENKLIVEVVVEAQPRVVKFKGID